MSRRTSRSTSRIVLTVAALVVGVFATPIFAESTSLDFFIQRVRHEATGMNWLLLIFFTTTWNILRTSSNAVELSRYPRTRTL
jgi:RsiW-degrading membrane proteinase PrsW (M82 family)